MVLDIRASIEFRTVFPDEYIEQWAKVFLANPGIRARGVKFETFLIAPQEIMKAILTPSHEVYGFEPLLPAQSLVSAKLGIISKLVRTYSSQVFH